MITETNIADGLIRIVLESECTDGTVNVILGSSETPETHSLNMPRGAYDDMVAIANHPDGEPEGVDIETAYARLTPLLAGCPQNLRPIP